MFVVVAVAVAVAMAVAVVVAPTAGLKAARVYIFAGTKDTVVVPGVADQLAKYYAIFTAPDGIQQVRNVSAE